MQNTELNDLRKVICLRKTSVSVERISVYKAIKIWWSMADTYATLHQIFNDFILSAMLLHKRSHRSVTIVTTEVCFTKPLGRMWSL